MPTSTTSTSSSSSSASLLDRFMPAATLRQIDRVAVVAEPERAYEVARAVDLYRVGFVRWLFQLRTLPERLAARARGEDAPPMPRSSHIDDLARPGTGFQILAEQPGREVVVGAIGRFWQPSIEFVEVDADEFAGFDRPGYGKLAWNIRVEPRHGGGSWVEVELRVGATDPASLHRFERYWWLIGPFSHAIRRGVLRLLRRELGDAPADDARPLPGDDLLPDAPFQVTHAVTIDAPVAQVWPWLVQMGASRAGWYSFDRIDNGGVRSATRIIPELQHLEVGDVIPALPDEPGGFAVLRLEPERLLVLGDPSLLPSGAYPGRSPSRTSWAFVLEPIGADATHLVVRVRADYEPSARMAVVRPFMRAAHEIMERRQLRNLRRRAESTRGGEARA